MLSERLRRWQKTFGGNKIGATKEGILRKHMLNEKGEMRDTVYFSIINDEWLAIRQTIFKEF